MLNSKTKDRIIFNIEENYKNYEKYFNLRDFIEQLNNIYLIFETNYMDKMNENINNYGINNYPEHLENEINRQNDEEIEIINQEKISEQAIDDIFKILLTSFNNTKTYINNFEKFDEFDKLITNILIK